MISLIRYLKYNTKIKRQIICLDNNGWTHTSSFCKFKCCNPSNAHSANHEANRKYYGNSCPATSTTKQLRSSGPNKLNNYYWFQSKETWYTSRICAESSVKSWAPFSFWALKVAIEYQGSDMRWNANATISTPPSKMPFGVFEIARLKPLLIYTNPSTLLTFYPCIIFL